MQVMAKQAQPRSESERIVIEERIVIDFKGID